LRVLERFLRRFRIVTLNEAIAATGVTLLRQYRLSHGLLIADALIAATALTIASPLVTKNQRDYRFIEGLELLPYPQAVT
jgi:predicted nucleic acid-binding protein